MAQKSKNKLNAEFTEACENGHLEIVRYLLTSPDLKEHADIHTDNDIGFQWACAYGHLEVVKYLLTSPELKEHANIHADEELGIRWACEYGNQEIVKYLLASPDLEEHADIHAENDCGFIWACRSGRLSVVQYLINDTDFYDLNRINEIDSDMDGEISKDDIIEMIKARDLKNQLSSEVSLKDKPRKKRLMI